MKRKLSDMCFELPAEIRSSVLSMLPAHGIAVIQLEEALSRLRTSRTKDRCCIVCRGQEGDEGYIVQGPRTFYECCVNCKHKLKYNLGPDNIFRRQVGDFSTDLNGGTNAFVNVPSIGFCRVRYLMEISWASYIRAELGVDL